MHKEHTGVSMSAFFFRFLYACRVFGSKCLSFVREYVWTSRARTHISQHARAHTQTISAHANYTNRRKFQDFFFLHTNKAAETRTWTRMAGLVREACGALGSLARLNDKNKNAIARDGGIEQVVGAMKSRLDTPALEQVPFTCTFYMYTL